MPTAVAGLSAQDAHGELTEQDRDIAALPGVQTVFGKIGRSDSATDPAPFSMAETTIRLKPRASWPRVFHARWYSSWAPEPVKRLLRRIWPERAPMTTDELVEHLDAHMYRPGWTNAWTAPVRARMDMMSTGVRTPVGVRVVAADPARLDALGGAVEAAVRKLPGTRSAVFEGLGGERRLGFELDAQALARWDVDPERARAVANFVATGGAIGEIPATEPSAKRPLPVRLALDAPWLHKPPQDVIRDATVRAGRDGKGQPVPLAFLGRPTVVVAPATLRSEHGELCGYVHVDLSEGTDLEGYLSVARGAVDGALHAGAAGLRPGERIEWIGQYELLVAGQRRLALIVPIVALLMLGLLWLQFRSVTEALIVLVSVPFALVGSFWTLYLLGYRLSAPVWVGLLSVVGLAMQTGVVMVVYIDEAYQRRLREGKIRSRADIIAAHAEGTVMRLRPKVMTIVTMTAALLPLLWAQGAGAEIMRRVAAPMIGGLVTSAFLTLEVIPVLYTIWRTRQLSAARGGLRVPAIGGAMPTRRRMVTSRCRATARRPRGSAAAAPAPAELESLRSAEAPSTAATRSVQAARRRSFRVVAAFGVPSHPMLSMLPPWSGGKSDCPFCSCWVRCRQRRRTRRAPWRAPTTRAGSSSRKVAPTRGLSRSSTPLTPSARSFRSSTT